MTTPTGPRDHDPIDGPVRSHLWRVRARLVTPPHEDRVQADLDRIVTAARRRAHEGPSADASAQPGPFASDASPDRPLAGSAGHGVARLPSADGAVQPAAAGDELEAARGRRRPAARITAQVVGRAAAVVLLVVSVGAGVAVARDGTVSLDVLLGRDPIQPRVDETDQIAGPGDDTASGDDAELSIDDDPDGAALEVPDEPADTSEAEVEDEGSGDGDGDGADAGTGDRDAGQADGSDGSGEGSSSSSSGASGGSSGSSDGSGSGSSGSSGSSNSGSSEEEGSDDAAGDEDEVIAAPEDNDELDGFGGRSDCDADDVEDCLDDADEEEGEDDSDNDEDDLADRRYRPDDGDDD